jgi:hypothetical protein
LLISFPNHGFCGLRFSLERKIITAKARSHKD